MALKTYTTNLMGDTMLGRLIDQLFPQHVDNSEEARIVQSFKIPPYTPQTPWGNTLPLLHSSDLNILNLETSATTHPTKWPDKVFNYRMHPANLQALKAARIDCLGLANNHTLDFCEEGLLETVRAVKGLGVGFAGAGESGEEARRPARLKLGGGEVLVWAASDHPQDWSQTPTFHFIDYTSANRDRLKSLLTSPATSATTRPAGASLRIISLHWGPNYRWQPSEEIRSLEHFLIDECHIDLIHGHSSHHVQGVEVYKGKLIIYGCGDFVDDYARVDGGWRNDLSAVWRVYVADEGGTDGKDGKLVVKALEVLPTKIERFRVKRLEADEEDARWVCEKVRELSAALGTEVVVDREQKIARLELG